MNPLQKEIFRKRTSGIVWVVIGLVALALGQAIKKPGFASNQDPGPQFFPFILASILVAGGVILFLNTWIGKQAPDVGGEQEIQSPTRNAILIYFSVGLGVYLLLLPWIGFSSSSFLFGSLMIWLQGTKWYTACFFSLLLIAGIQFLFGTFFHVQLPPGVLGLP